MARSLSGLATALGPRDPGALPHRFVVPGFPIVLRARFDHLGLHDWESHKSNQTWAWDGAAWHLASAGGHGSPSARRECAMAGLGAKKQVVVFGGESDTCGTGRSPGICGDTWTWDGTAWAEATPVLSPSPRHGHAMVYDEGRGALVLYGGVTGIGFDGGETWEWFGSNWILREKRSPPGNRVRHLMAYDPHRRRVVLYGGSGVSGGTCRGKCADIWEWDGSTWTLASPFDKTPSRDYATLVYNPTLDRVVLYGGTGSDCPRAGCEDALLWDGTRIERLSLPEAPRGRMAWDEARREMVLYGGTSGNAAERAAQTWVWR